jgi:hypothetical protein
MQQSQAKINAADLSPLVGPFAAGGFWFYGGIGDLAEAASMPSSLKSRRGRIRKKRIPKREIAERENVRLLFQRMLK